MQYLFALLVVVALVACAMAQYYPYGSSYGYNTHAGLAYPYAGNYAGYNTYGAYNPAYSYLWKK